MPVSKKPRAKATDKTSSKAGTPLVLPDRRAMESFLAAISGRRGVDAAAKAQDVMYEAWEQAASPSRIALARKALGISPLCADAYVLLAEEAARSVEEARDYYAKGVEAGELALGPRGFEEYAGHFWGFLETRPYMRARAGLASALRKLGDIDGAIDHFREMLRLNPNDNQGIRYALLGCLFDRGDDGALKQLLAAYEDDAGVFWLYTRALLAFRDGGETDQRAAALAKKAFAANEHVPAILAGEKPPVHSDSGYITMGGPDEASYYATECGSAWRRTPDAISWLTRLAAAPKRRPRRTIH
jgi:tetratricopeptide (TPR) repeat protein